LFIWPPPDLIVVEALKAPFDLWQEVVDQMIARASDELLACLIHGFGIFSQADAFANSSGPNRVIS
jgi:hypothetical protein